MADETPARGFISALATRAQTALTRAVGSLVGPLSPVETPRPLTQQYLYVGVQTPDDVAALMRFADTGFVYRLCDFWDEQVNRDCHLGTVKYRREHAVAPLKWQVIPASDKRRDLKIASWTEDVLRRMGEVEHRESVSLGLTPRSFSDLLVHLNGANFQGYSGSEIAWSKANGWVVPAGALPMHPRRFIFSQLDGSLRWYDATGGPADNVYPGKDLLCDFAPGRFMVHRPRVNGAVGTREGIWRPLIWASLFRTWVIGDWMKLAELMWKGNRWAEYTKGTTGKNDRIAAQNALQMLLSQFYAVVPDNIKMHFEYPKNYSKDNYAGLAAFFAAEMSKLALGATLTVEQGKTGAHALGQVHENVERGLRDTDARTIEGTVQRQLIGPLVRANFGAVPLPHYVFVTEETGDLKLVADAINALRGKGELTGIPMSWVRQLLGAPEPEIGDELLGGGVWAGKPELPPEPVANDSGGPNVSDAAVKAAYQNYRVHTLLCAAGVRTRRAA